MSRLKKTWYALVQHSAFAARGDETFRNAVEPAGLSTQAELGKVMDAGGAVFDDYTKADDAADAVNEPHLDPLLFPDQVKDGAVPTSLSFDSSITIGGRSLYLPPNAPAE